MMTPPVRHTVQWNRKYTEPGPRRPWLPAGGIAFINIFNYAFFLPGSKMRLCDKAVRKPKSFMHDWKVL